MSYEVLVFSVLGLNCYPFLRIADKAVDQDASDLNPWPYVFVKKIYN
jgi:hypothetical protein